MKDQNCENYENHLYENLEPKDFECLETIGEGSYGKVYKCENKTKLGKFFAIKRFVIPQNNSIDSKDKKNEIIKEMNNLATLQTYNFKPSSLPNYYGYYKETDKFKEANHCLVFDYFPMSLRNFLNQEKNPLDLQNLKKIYDSLLYGMTFLQIIDISHRDLKPENLAFDESGCLKILDFGGAKNCSKIEENSKSNNEMTIFGSKNYMAPEILEALEKDETHQERNSYKSDVFSFGLIILEIGTFKKIIHDGNVEVLKKEITKNLAKFKDNYKSLKGSERKEFKKIYRIIEKCVEIESKERPDFIEIFTSNLMKDKMVFHILIES